MGRTRPKVRRNKETPNLIEEMNVFKCKECGKTFTSRGALKRHIEHHTGQYSHFCSICKKGYSNPYNYKIHMRAHEGRGYSCDFCGKVFKSQHAKRYHEAEHTGKHNFICEMCNKGFIIKSQYIKHLSGHHG